MMKEKNLLRESKKLCWKATKHAATSLSSKSEYCGSNAISHMKRAISIRESVVGRYTDPLLGGMYYELANYYKVVDDPNTTRYWMLMNVAYRIQCRSCIENSIYCYDSNGRTKNIRISRDDMPSYPILQHSIKIEVKGDAKRFKGEYTAAVKDYSAVIQWEKKMIYNGVSSSSSSSSSCPTIAYLTRKIYVCMVCLRLNLSDINDWDKIDRITTNNGPIATWWLKKDEQQQHEQGDPPTNSCDISIADVLVEGDNHLSNCNYNQAIDAYRAGMVDLARDSLHVRKLIDDICSKKIKLKQKQKKSANTTTTTTAAAAAAAAADSKATKEADIKRKVNTAGTTPCCTRTRSEQRPLFDEMHVKILEIIQQTEAQDDDEEGTITITTGITRDEDDQQKQTNHDYDDDEGGDSNTNNNDDDVGNVVENENPVEINLPGKACLQMFVPYGELSLFSEKKEEEN